MQVTVILQIELTKNETVRLLSILTASIRLQEHQWMHAPLRKICFRKIRDKRKRGKKKNLEKSADSIQEALYTCRSYLDCKGKKNKSTKQATLQS